MVWKRDPCVGPVTYGQLEAGARPQSGAEGAASTLGGGVEASLASPLPGRSRKHEIFLTHQLTRLSSSVDVHVHACLVP